VEIVVLGIRICPELAGAVLETSTSVTLLDIALIVGFVERGG
jgi:hypothetical protein